MNELLTIEEAATRVKMATKTIRRWIKAGRLRALKAGKEWRIRAEDLDTFLQTTAAEALRPPAGPALN